MALRFRKSVRIAPGIKINFGKRGISTTVGPRGLSFNVSRRGTYLNAGIPGTGISSRTTISSKSTSTSNGGLSHGAPVGEASIEHHPHMRFRTIIIFFVTMVAAGITRNAVAMDVFWAGWACYWLYCGARKLVTKGRSV